MTERAMGSSIEWHELLLPCVPYSSVPSRPATKQSQPNSNALLPFRHSAFRCQDNLKMALFARRQKLWLTAFALVYAWLFFLCRFHSAQDPTSYFFEPEIGYRPEYSISRIHESLHFLSRRNYSSVDTVRPSTNCTLCVGIVTVKRPLVQNLNVTVGSLLDGLSQEQRSRVSIHVLFAHTKPSDHPDYGQSWVSRYVDRALTYDQLEAPLSKIRRLESERRVSEKSLVDYRLALHSCHKQVDSPWILMLEDDVVAQRRWYEDTLQAIQIVQQSERRGIVKRWLYLRLFYTEKFLGWNMEEWPAYLSWSIAVVGMTGVIGMYARQHARSWQGILTNSLLTVVCLVCVPLAILLYFLAGRMTVQPMKPGVHFMNRHGCCSQALLFPREQVPLVVDYLDQRQRTFPQPVDSVIEKLGDEQGMDRLAISPSQMQHVGAASYKENRAVYQWEGMHRVHGAHGVWSVGFERAFA